MRDRKPSNGARPYAARSSADEGLRARVRQCMVEGRLAALQPDANATSPSRRAVRAAANALRDEILRRPAEARLAAALVVIDALVEEDVRLLREYGGVTRPDALPDANPGFPLRSPARSAASRRG